MAIVIENSAYSAVTNDSTPSLAITTPAANNLLVACISIVSSNADWGADTPSGWTNIENFIDGGTLEDGQLIYKIADGTETTIDWGNVGAGSDPTMGYVELSGLATSSVLEDSAEDASNIAGSVSSQGSGSATPISANGIAVAFFGVYNATSWNAGRAYTNSYTEIGTPAVLGFNPLSLLAYKVYSTTAAQTTTFSTSESGGNAYGSIAVFKEAAAAGGIKTASLDAMLQKQGLLKTASLDAMLQKVEILQASLDAALRKNNVLSTASLDSMLRKTVELTASLDAHLVGVSGTLTASLDAMLQKLVTLNSSLDALLKKQDIVLTADLDAILVLRSILTASLDARLYKAGVALSVSMDGILTIVSGQWTKESGVTHSWSAASAAISTWTKETSL